MKIRQLVSVSGVFTPSAIALILCALGGLAWVSGGNGGMVYAQTTKCVRVGTFTTNDNIPVCDCTQGTNGGTCTCIYNPPCAPSGGGEEEMN